MKTAVNSFLLALAMSLGLGTGAFAAGSDDDDDFASREYRKAVKAIKAERYQEAVDLLEDVVRDEPKNADAYSYLGFSNRKLERYDEALAHYNRALELKPKHKGANEYLGELYLEQGNLEGAEQQLAVLDKACFFPCSEYKELKKMIEAYKEGSEVEKSW